MAPGRLEAIFVSPTAKAEPASVSEARAVVGRGLAGDRYAEGTGTWWKAGKAGQELTLIEAEALDELARVAGVQLAPAEARRNLLTRGIRLHDLIGQRFSIGEVTCIGRRTCPPCSHLESLTIPGLMAGLADSGGLRADIVTGGRIAVGDLVVAMGPAGEPPTPPQPAHGAGAGPSI
jgi:MOSC domain-containing protein YiiM